MVVVRDLDLGTALAVFLAGQRAGIRAGEIKRLGRRVIGAGCFHDARGHAVDPDS